MEDFHFLRPAWLLALPRGWPSCGPTRDAFAPESAGGTSATTPCCLTCWCDGTPSGLSPLPLLMGTGLLLAVFALAGPAWHDRDVPVHRVKQARIVVLDLSRSMDAPDVQPSRLARARLKAAEILAMTDEGQAGLVVFAGDAFAVSPLTDDSATLNAMLPALSTELMPARGSRADLGLRRAGSLLRPGRTDAGRSDPHRRLGRRLSHRRSGGGARA